MNWYWSYISFKVGKQEIISLAEFSRERYTDFVPEKYSSNDIRVYCGDTFRSCTSAQHFLQGLYPNVVTETASIQIAQQALAADPFEIPEYKFHYYELQTTDEYFGKLYQKYRDVYQYMAYNSMFSVFALPQAYILYDVLSLEARNNFTLPKWTEEVFPTKLTEMSKEFSRSLCYDKELQRIGKLYSCYNNNSKMEKNYCFNNGA